MTLSLKNKIVCFTGKLSRVRRVARQELEDIGGFFSTSITANTDIIICGDNCGSKLLKAKQLGIQIWTENDFNDAILNGGNIAKNGTNKKRKNMVTLDDMNSDNEDINPKPKKKRKLNKNNKPNCKYGGNCFRKNKQHLKDFNHPNLRFDELSSDDDDLKDRNKGNNNICDSNDNGNDCNSDSESESDVDLKNELKLVKLNTENEGLISDNEDDIREYLTQKWETKYNELMNINVNNWNTKFIKRINKQNIVLTGWFPLNRNKIIKLIKQCNGKITGIINDETQLLIVGQRPGNKLFDAYHQGIPILYYTDMAILIGINDRSNSIEL